MVAGTKYGFVAENWVLYSSGKIGAEYGGTRVRRCIISAGRITAYLVKL